MKAFAKVLVTALVFVAPASLALADSAVVLGDLNVRAGPGTNYSVIGTLGRGMNVQVLSCSPAWCSIGWRGPAFVSAAYLGFDGPPPYMQSVPVPAGPGIYAAPPPVQYYPAPGFYGPPPAPGPYIGFGVWSW
ncbi:SH3 domain-containing protein [Xanthobacter sp. DSM 24535]|uniref:SH3 domain-containing protein n=1 Tax=Roseixanthobacter psychrophilus TaxID=3119917 RepID=UPI00372B8B3D